MFEKIIKLADVWAHFYDSTTYKDLNVVSDFLTHQIIRFLFSPYLSLNHSEYNYHPMGESALNRIHEGHSSLLVLLYPFPQI
jgi:hypothetical protein